jgi:UDP-N-acetylglucosamine:LPS N-acetylglucosamine transferase
MNQNAPKILIISSDTGGGHRSAAAAIVEGVGRFWQGQSAIVRVVKAVEESHHITARGVKMYNWILCHRQPWMKYFYWFFNRFRPEQSGFIHKRCFGFCKELFERWCPHIIVSVHPMTQHIFARVLKEVGLLGTVPLVTVVTDPCYGFWKGWACEDVTLYLVANEDAERQLIDYGIAPQKIKISGMPVHPKFHFADEADAKIARQAFGLDPEKFTIFVNSGFIGGGNIPEIFRELVRGELDVQAIFLAGRNEELKKEAEAIAKNAKFPVRVIGYSDEIDKLMQSANVMISKLGGLTTFEALACRLPIIADTTTTPMPQEAGTVNLINKRGAGVLLEKASDIVPVIQNLLADKTRYEAMREATRGLSMPNSTQNIVREIAALLPAASIEVETQVIKAA